MARTGQAGVEGRDVDGGLKSSETGRESVRLLES